jgi:hypothetical protein
MTRKRMGRGKGEDWMSDWMGDIVDRRSIDAGRCRVVERDLFQCRNRSCGIFL